MRIAYVSLHWPRTLISGVGKKIVRQSPEHFRELADYYLAHEEERKKIIELGYQCVISHHTYEQRLKKVFEVLN